MAYKFYNANPDGKLVDDCVIRALTLALDMDWDSVAVQLCLYQLKMHDMPNSNALWDKLLKDHGFNRYIVPDTCPDCYTAEDFCDDNPDGTFVLGFDTHVAAVVDGVIYDLWDSSKEVPSMVWYEKDNPPKEDDDEL